MRRYEFHHLIWAPLF